MKTLLVAVALWAGFVATLAARALTGIGNGKRPVAADFILPFPLEFSSAGGQFTGLAPDRASASTGGREE